MAVFITGGHGHIGSWIAYQMAKKNKKIIIYDIKADYPDYLQEVQDNIIFIPGDVMDMARLYEMVKKNRDQIEGIIHTVGIMGEFVAMNPHQHVKLNIEGLLNILEVARIHKIAKVIYTSTGAVYSNKNDSIVNEESPIYPPDLYAATKISAEYLGQQYEATFGIDFRVARVYFIYGPGKLPSDFIRLYQLAFGALEGLKGLSLPAGSEQRLDFTYVKDAAKGIGLLFEKEQLHYKIFNIATGVASKIEQVMKLSKQASYCTSELKIGSGKLMKRCEALDITRASKELNYRPVYSLEQGIKEYSEWIRQNKNSGS